MTDTSAGDSEDSGGDDAGDDALEEVREAASAVVGSLKSLLVAAEKVISDPEAFKQVVSGGKGLFEAFTSGFTDDSSRSGDATPDA